MPQSKYGSGLAPAVELRGPGGRYAIHGTDTAGPVAAARHATIERTTFDFAGRGFVFGFRRKRAPSSPRQRASPVRAMRGKSAGVGRRGESLHCAGLRE